MWEKGLILLVALSVAAVAIVTNYHRMQDAKRELEDYRAAQSCVSENNCRRKVEATILEGEEHTITINVISRTGHTHSNKNTTYFISVSTGVETHNIEISPNPPSNGTPFDIQNVRIPTGSDSKFIEENFYKGKPAYVEVWNGKITLLFLDTLIDVPDLFVQLTPLPNIQTTVTARIVPNTFEIALPTTVHPIFLQASTEYDFTATTFVCSIILIVLVSVLFGEDIAGLRRAVSGIVMRNWKRVRSA